MESDEIVAQKFQYKNRDVDWVSFNGRVLQEAMDTGNPLFERLKFLAIFSSNLDEFFKVRISKLRQISKVKKSIRKPLALKPNKILKQILEKVQLQQEQFGQIFREHIKPELAQYGIHLLDLSECNTTQKAALQTFFREEIEPTLRTLKGSQITLDVFEDGALYIVVLFEDTDKMAFLPVQQKGESRFIAVPGPRGTLSYVFREDIIKMCAGPLFPEAKINDLFNIKISRDAELYLEDDYEGEWAQQIYDALGQRRDGQPTRLLYEGTMPKDVQKRLRNLFGLGKVDMVRGGNRHNFSDFFDFPFPENRPELLFEPFPQLSSPEFQKATDFFELIRRKDRILHFPYQDFGYLEQWLMQAAEDVSVQGIQISLYRIAKNSQLTSALLSALKNGKQVTIFVEAKARFDEENNLKWGRIFEEKGAQVFYSFPNVKVHSKILLIERIEEGRFGYYAYIGTGNFNAKTSKIYCDHGLFTANRKITDDLRQVFRVLKREVLVPKLRSLLVSPYNSRAQFESLIQREIENANQGLPAKIVLKMNSLEDRQMIDWLYRASLAGVEIKLLVRGICALLPQIDQLSERITVLSIVDRFLEHARVFLFHNGGKEKMFLGSADWMTRNLDKRLEVIAPIEDPEIFDELKHILELQLADTRKVRILDGEGRNQYAVHKSSGEPIRAQYAIYEYLKGKSTT